MATDQSADVPSLGDETLDATVAAASGVVMVDFWAEWCAPCHAMMPLVAALAGDYQGRMQVAKLNIDEHPDAAKRYQVRAVPALLIFKQGKEVDRVVGLVSRSKLDEILTKYL